MLAYLYFKSDLNRHNYRIDMKIRPLFKKHQKELVAFANTSHGKELLESRGAKFEAPIVKVTPDGVYEWFGGNVFRATFHPRSPFIKIFSEVLTMVDIAKENGFDTQKKDLVIPHFLGETRLLRNELPQIFLASGDPFYPDEHIEVSSVDGNVFRSLTAGNGTAWTALRNGAGTGSSDTTALDVGMLIRSGQAGNEWRQISRSIYLFDTNSLDDTIIITPSTLSLYAGSKGDNISITPNMNLYASTPNTNTALIDSDYGQIDTTEFATTITFAGMTDTAYNDFTLNASGLAAIDVAGISKFGMRNANYDVANSAPTRNADNQASFFVTNFAAQTGTDKDPKLVVNFTLPVSGGNPMFFQGGGIGVA